MEIFLSLKTKEKKRKINLSINNNINANVATLISSAYAAGTLFLKSVSEGTYDAIIVDAFDPISMIIS